MIIAPTYDLHAVKVSREPGSGEREPTLLDIVDAVLEAYLNPFQIRFYRDDSDVVLALKSRRIGFSLTVVCKMVRCAAAGLNDVFYFCYDDEIGKEVMDKCAELSMVVNEALVDAGYAPILGPERFSLLKKSVHFLSKKFIKSLGSRPKKARGRQGVIVFDEFAFLPYPMLALEAAMAHLDWGGQIIILSTHFGDQNPFVQLVHWAENQTLDEPSPLGPISYHRVTIIDAVKEGLFRKMCEVRGKPWSQKAEDDWLARKLAEPWADQEYLCIPAKGGDNYLPRHLVESCMEGRRVIRLRLDEGFEKRSEPDQIQFMKDWYRLNMREYFREEYLQHEVYLGWDFARSPVGDLSVLTPLRLNQDLLRDGQIILEMKGVPHNRQLELIRMMAPDMPKMRRMYIDAGSVGSYVGDECVKLFGATRCEKIAVGRPFYKEHFPALRAGFESRKLRLPADVEILSDFAAVTLDKGDPIIPHVREKSASMGSRHADAAVAVLLAYAASRVPKPSFDLRGPKKYPQRGDQWRFM